MYVYAFRKAECKCASFVFFFLKSNLLYMFFKRATYCTCFLKEQPTCTVHVF